MTFLAASSCARGPTAGSPEEIARLEKVRDELRARIVQLASADPIVRALPEGNVLVGMPVATATHLVREITEGFLDEIEIVLRGIEIHKAGDVKVKKAILTLKAGQYVLDVRIEEARALLKPGKPQVSFEKARFGVRLPVRLAKGSGRSKVAFRWDSQGVADWICDDFAIEKTLSGSVPPRTYDVEGAFELEVSGGRLVAQPRFPARGIVVEITVEPSEESWKFVEEVIADRPAGCARVMKMINMRKVLSDLLGKGFKVRVPSKVFKTIDLPAGLEQEIEVEGKRFALTLKPTRLELTPEVLWYGAVVEAARALPSAPSSSLP